jgi:hypothetical protein
MTLFRHDLPPDPPPSFFFMVVNVCIWIIIIAGLAVWLIYGAT